MSESLAIGSVQLNSFVLQSILSRLTAIENSVTSLQETVQNLQTGTSTSLETKIHLLQAFVTTLEQTSELAQGLQVLQFSSFS